MSSAEESTPEVAVKEGVSRPRRRNNRGPGGRGGRGMRNRRGGRGGGGRRTTEDGTERPPRPEPVPIPDEFVGQEKEGIVTSVIRRGRVRFGFIAVDGKDVTEEYTLPRLYFDNKNIVDQDLILRRGYFVSFKVVKDDKDRPGAVSIVLTEEGKKVAEEREAVIAQKKLENPIEPGRRERNRTRKPVPEKLMNLTVTCDGQPEEKILEFDLAQSVGRLKNTAVTAFDAPATFFVYHVSDEYPTGVFLTKAIMNALKENDKILIAPPREGDVKPSAAAGADAEKA